jgi:hypothetical protein
MLNLRGLKKQNKNPSTSMSKQQGTSYDLDTFSRLHLHVLCQATTSGLVGRFRFEMLPLRFCFIQPLGDCHKLDRKEAEHRYHKKEESFRPKKCGHVRTLAAVDCNGIK